MVDAQEKNAVSGAVSEATVHLVVNGDPYAIPVQPQWTLQYVLAELLGLTGTKEFCGEGACGACTVHAWTSRPVPDPAP